MPDATQFLNWFGLIQCSQFGGYSLDSATSTHESVKRYHEYKYDITLIFKNRGYGNYNYLFQHYIWNS